MRGSWSVQRVQCEEEDLAGGCAFGRRVGVGSIGPTPTRPVADAFCPPIPLPEGTVTFLFTDIQGSTRLWEQQPEAMPEALARHQTLLSHAIEGHGGAIFKSMGDGVCAAFATAMAPGLLTARIIAGRRRTRSSAIDAKVSSR